MEKYAKITQLKAQVLEYLKLSMAIDIQHGTSNSYGSGALNSCYNSNSYIVSSPRKLKTKDFEALRFMGVIGYGQEYHVVNYNPEINSEQLYVYKVNDLIDSSG